MKCNKRKKKNVTNFGLTLRDEDDLIEEGDKNEEREQKVTQLFFYESSMKKRESQDEKVLKPRWSLS